MEGIQLPIKINTICIVGGGFAGWYTAAALSHNFPNIKLTVVDSDKHPRLGVGETLGWSSPYDWKRLLGLKDDRMLMWNTGAIYKYGVTANNFYRDNSSYTNGKFFNLKVKSLSKFYGEFDYPDFEEPWSHNEGDVGLIQAWMELNRDNKKDFNDYVLELNETSHFSKNPVAPYDINNHYVLRPKEGWSYHIDAEQTVEFFKKKAMTENTNCCHINNTIVSVKLSSDETIEKILLEDGREVSSDLFIDASGFARVLVKNLRNNKWKDMGSEFCNTACVCPTGYADPHVEMTGGTEFFGEEHGWRFKINLYHRIGNGYIFNDNMVNPQRIMDYITKLTESRRLADPRFIKWTPGYYTESWMGNVIPVGVSGHLIDPFDGPSFDIHSRALEDIIVAFNKDDLSKAKTYFNESQSIVKKERNMRLITIFGISKRQGKWWDSRRDIFDRSVYKKNLLDTLSNNQKEMETRLRHFWHQMYYRMFVLSDMDRTQLPSINLSDSDSAMSKSFFSYNRARNRYISEQQWPNYYEWLKENRFNGLSSHEMLEILNPTLTK